MGKYVKGDSCRCVSLNEIQKSSGKTCKDNLFLAVNLLVK